MTAVAAAAILTAGVVVSVRILHSGQPPRSPARVTVPLERYAHLAAPVPADAPETDPALAAKYAEGAVGSCLLQAWGNAGYNNVFARYTSAGVVEFSTGSAANPTGTAAARTLIFVRVFADHTVADNAALDYWGCPPHTFSPRGGVPVPVSTPPGMQADGPLDVACSLHGTRGYTSFHAQIDMYNPGSISQAVSGFAISWGSNGILLSQQAFTGPWTIAPGQDQALTAGPAPASATSCAFAGWNP
ncbi:MAG: hypothetical protein M0030_23005 [Actinomycetota bacterium]|nr:hypothetical protein [Actinomycetota bacterium]